MIVLSNIFICLFMTFSCLFPQYLWIEYQIFSELLLTDLKLTMLEVLAQYGSSTFTPYSPVFTTQLKALPNEIGLVIITRLSTIKLYIACSSKPRLKACSVYAAIPFTPNKTYCFSPRMSSLESKVNVLTSFALTDNSSSVLPFQLME